MLDVQRCEGAHSALLPGVTDSPFCYRAHMRPLILLFLGTIACGPPAWQAAQRDGSARAYEQFATEYAKYPQSNTAMNRAENLRWARAEEAQSAAAWSAYLRMHHESNRADKARSAMDDAAYREALEDKDALALERYLSMFPAGTHRKEARGHLDAVRWQQAKSEDTHVSYRRYLLQELDGEHREKAQARYGDRMWERAGRIDTLRSYRLYLAEFPESEHSADAHARIGELTFTKVQLAVVLGRSWQKDRRKALSTLRSEAQRLLPANLKSVGFQIVGSVMSGDIGEDASLDPSSVVQVKDGHGLVVVVVNDHQGEAFKPRGFATEMQAEVQVYVPARAGNLASWPAAGRTSDRVRSIEEWGLYKDAANILMADAAGQVGRTRDWHPNPP